jgi:hypothetical protein
MTMVLAIGFFVLMVLIPDFLLPKIIYSSPKMNKISLFALFILLAVATSFAGNWFGFGIALVAAIYVLFDMVFGIDD